MSDEKDREIARLNAIISNGSGALNAERAARDWLAREKERLENVIKTGGAMYRAERAAMGIPGGEEPLPLPPRLPTPTPVNPNPAPIEDGRALHLEAMAKRPGFPEIYMDMAHGLRRRSTCRRLSVGCLIVSEDWSHVFSVGYNGSAKGCVNDCDSTAAGACGCVHSEDNACTRCYVGPNQAKIAIVTHLPCVVCAKRFINLGGVKRVIFEVEYRTRTSIGILIAGGIEVSKLVRSTGDEPTSLVPVNG